MDNFRQVLRVSLLILAVGMFFAGILFAIQASMPAILYLTAGLICVVFERLIKLSEEQ